MQVVIPLEGRVRTILRSPVLISHRQSESEYSLSGETFQMSGIAPTQVLILPDDADVTEGASLTDEVKMLALPIETFTAPSAEEVLSDALGLVLRAAVADGRITDAELLRVAPALEGRIWQKGMTVAAGDVYSFGGFLWRCIQAHTTQGDWPPERTPALWRKVEVVTEDIMRVWDVGIEYAVGDMVAYSDTKSARYECLQTHTSQEGWEPPNAPALWKAQAAI
ncbi:MAG: hypothetical protein RR975_12720 [Clostridia bacterium]